MQVHLPLLPALLCLAAASTSLPSRRQYQDGPSLPDTAAALLYRYSVGSSDGDYNAAYDDTKLDPLQNTYGYTVQDNNDNVDDTIRILYGRDGQVYDVDGPNDPHGLYTYSDKVEEQEEESRDEPKGFSDSFGKSGVQVHGSSYSSSHGNSQGKSSGSYGTSYGHGHAGHTYRGRYAGRCHYDGLYYHDEKSFIMCSNGNAYLQYCAPGTRNSAYNGYGHGSHGLSGGHRGHGGHGYGGHGNSYNYRDFCDVNLVDYGYAAIRSHGHGGGYGGHNRHGSRGYSVHGYSSYGRGGHGYGGHSYGYSSHHGGLNHGRGY